MGRIIASILLLFALQLQGNPKRVALIVAIGDYPSELGWSKLSSVNDVELIKNALLFQGFKSNDIIIVTDADATKKGILNAIDDFYKRVQKNSIAFFHYSGHGQQIVDLVGDEVDGLDESIIPIDAGISYEICPAKGNNHLRDDLLGELLTKIRRKIGPQGELIVSLDACHSGTATRGIGVARGTSIVFAPPNHQQQTEITSNFNRTIMEGANTKNLSPMVVFSGSSSTQLNYEYVVVGKNYGSLSYALSKALHQITPDLTYRAVFGKVKVIMSSIAPRQTPQLEGDVDRLFFNGTAVEQKNFTTVRLWRNSESVVLSAGQLNGFSNNSLVEFYPIGTTDPSNSKAISSGRVVNAQLTEALVILDKPITKKHAEESWVFIKEVGFGLESLSVRVSANISTELRNNLLSTLNKFQFIKLVDHNPELHIDIEQSAPKKLIVVSREDIVVFSESISDNETKRLVDGVTNQIKLFVQAQLLRSLESNNSRFRVSFEMIPVKLNENYVEIDRLPLSSKTNSSGQLVFNKGDFFRFRITNHGNRRAYYSLLNIQSDNVVNILVPEKDQYGNPFRAPADCKIDPGKTEELRAVFYVKEPFGQEVFKLIASNRPLQLDQVLQTRGQVSDYSLLHPFELIFADSFDLLNRSSTSHRLPPEFINIHTVVFNIVPIK